MSRYYEDSMYEMQRQDFNDRVAEDRKYGGFDEEVEPKESEHDLQMDLDEMNKLQGELIHNS